MLPPEFFKWKKRGYNMTCTITSPLCGSEKVSQPQEEARVLGPIWTPPHTLMFHKQCWVLLSFDFSYSTPFQILPIDWYFLDFLKRFYLFLGRGEGREKERERNINVWLPLMCPPTGDLNCNPGMCPDWESNQQPFGLQAGAQSTEPHQPGS